jgi:aminopeptidase N
VDSAGPIIWGSRLNSSHAPSAWRIITYEKGSWILHMLRRQMGDPQFLAMLAELRRQYQWKGVSTEQFRALAARFLPPKSPDPQLSNFFDQWVYGTGIPSLKLSYSVKGKGAAYRVEGKITQGDAGDDFSVPVPVEIQFARGKPLTRIVETGGGAASSFTVALRQPPAKVVLDPSGAVLRR